MAGERGGRAVLVFAVLLPPLTLLGLVAAFDRAVPQEWPGGLLAFAYVIGICPAVFTGVAWRRMLERGWRRPARFAGAAAAHPFAALFFIAPSFLLLGSRGFLMWLLCVPVFVGAALAGGLVAESVWPRAARRSLAETRRFPT